MEYNRVILDSIEREKAGVDYHCPEKDRAMLHELFGKINALAGTSFQYLAEIDAFRIKGSGKIIAQYITKFTSESIKALLIPQLVFDGVEDCDMLLLHMYLNFKSSDEYISLSGMPAPAHIYVRYDNAFRTLKPKRLKNDLVKLAQRPRDAFYLPLTMRMLASWKIPDLEELFLLYSSSANVSAKDLGITENGSFFPPYSFMQRELRFTAIDALKYYPSSNTAKIINQYINDPDPDIRAAANKSLKKILTKIERG